jgi:hypothetical protein
MPLPSLLEHTFTVADQTVGPMESLAQSYYHLPEPTGTGQFDGATSRIDSSMKGLVNVRGMSNIIWSMTALGLMGGDTGRVLEAVYRAAIVNYSIWMVYEGITAAVNAQAAITTAAAVAETIAHAAAQDWANIALAVSMAALAYSTFQFASGSWELPSFDMGNPSERRQALNDARAQAVV